MTHSLTDILALDGFLGIKSILVIHHTGRKPLPTLVKMELLTNVTQIVVPLISKMPASGRV